MTSDMAGNDGTTDDRGIGDRAANVGGERGIGDRRPASPGGTKSSDTRGIGDRVAGLTTDNKSVDRGIGDR